jgi:pyridoxal biosynthesis lyase PdxS
MADATIVEAIMKAVTIPVMAKCRIGRQLFFRRYGKVSMLPTPLTDE